MSELTKRALEESLKHMLLKKPLDKVTINDITSDCGVNRMTFYYHFKDIYDLVEWSCEEEAKKILAGKKTYSTWEEGFLNIFEAVRANKPFVMNVSRSISREKIESYLLKVTAPLLEDVVREESEGLTLTEEDKAFVIEFCRFGFVGLILDWTNDDMQGDPQTIVDKVSRLIRGNLRKAMEGFRKD